jgi:hypothetical protein
VLAGSTAYAIGEGRKWPVGLSQKPKEAVAPAAFDRHLRIAAPAWQLRKMRGSELKLLAGCGCAEDFRFRAIRPCITPHCPAVEAYTGRSGYP